MNDVLFLRDFEPVHIPEENRLTSNRFAGLPVQPFTAKECVSMKSEFHMDFKENTSRSQCQCFF